ncbi:MAG: hypothetical protein HeimC3_32070 [Candidatus Heimdallarchaeota archaeon LC_3]|nr:MAG: hypothetical protein HeimC3_32070 [Candidatus Heimdallarchaeota archaeon LC_3]
MKNLKEINELVLDFIRGNDISTLPLIDSIYLLFDRTYFNYTSIFIDNKVSRSDLWKYIELNLAIRYDLTTSDLKIIEDFLTKAVSLYDIDMVTGLHKIAEYPTRPGSKLHYNNLNRYALEIIHHYRYLFNTNVLNSILNLSLNEKRYVWTFLNFYKQFSYFYGKTEFKSFSNFDFENINKQFKKMFNDSTPKNIPKLLTKAKLGLLNTSDNIELIRKPLYLTGELEAKIIESLNVYIREGVYEKYDPFRICVICREKVIVPDSKGVCDKEECQEKSKNQLD